METHNVYEFTLNTITLGEEETYILWVENPFKGRFVTLTSLGEVYQSLQVSKKFVEECFTGSLFLVELLFKFEGTFNDCLEHLEIGGFLRLEILYGSFYSVRIQ